MCFFKHFYSFQQYSLLICSEQSFTKAFTDEFIPVGMRPVVLRTVAAPGGVRGGKILSCPQFSPQLSVKSRKNEPAFCEIIKNGNFPVQSGQKR